MGCAAYNCFNNLSNKTKNQDNLLKKKVTFHKFSKNAALQKIWIQNMRLANLFCNHTHIFAKTILQKKFISVAQNFLSL
ncbi:MAG: THAP domain-containing protein [bacterium]|nr:THAP domain-containing protein [bacterium]